MIVFWALVAGLIGLALLFVFPPLVARRKDKALAIDQNQINLAVFRRQIEELDADLAAGKLDQTLYDAARRDLERELLEDVGPTDAPAGDAASTGGRWAVLVLAPVVPAAAIALYLYLGNSGIIPQLDALAGGKPPATHPSGGGQEMPPLDVLVQRLAEKMEQNPDNLEGWLMLGRTYFAVGQPEQARDALQRAYNLAPRQPDVLVAYAEALAANRDGELAGRPAELLRAALDVDPGNANARWLDGLLAFQQGQYAAAVARWEGLLAELEPQSENAGELRGFIDEARRQGGLTAPGPAPAAPAPVTAAEPVGGPIAQDAPAPQETASLTVAVSLAEPLRSGAQPDDTLFVYAKAIAGPPMPLAVKRLRAGDLPVTVTLDDSMAMMPALRLSAFPEVTVGARVSRSGQATAQSGDLEGEASPVKPGQVAPVAVLVDRVRP